MVGVVEVVDGVVDVDVVDEVDVVDLVDVEEDDDVVDVVVDVVEEVVVEVVDDEVDDEVDEVVVVLCTDARNSNTLLLPLSPTQRFPDESKAKLPGLLSPVWLVPANPVEKPGCPSTKVASIPLEKVGVNPKIRLFPASETQTFPEESAPIANGSNSWLWDVPAALAPKFRCPITKLAPIPLEKGDLNSRALLFAVSATQRFPLGSKPTDAGNARWFWDVA
jgi:hypothetical protein